MGPTIMRPLEILIVGGGIGGLMAAVAFRSQGHNVTILEKTELGQETGAAVHICPNAHGLLRRYGILPEEFGANPVNGVAEYFHDGTLRNEINIAKTASMFPHLWVLGHRIALHDKLKDVATSADGINRPAVLKTRSRVVEVDPVTATVILEDGTNIKGDLVIGADGVSSVTRKYVAGDIKPFASGKSAFRFFVPHDRIRACPETRHLVEQDGVMRIWFGNDRRLVMYPCNNNTTINCAAIHPSSESAAKVDDGWGSGVSKDTLLAVYKNFAPEIMSLFKLVDPSTLQIWSLLDMDRIPRWTTGRLALLGDAAHPTLPNQGQGAGIAMEDAVSLAVLMPLGISPNEIPERLELYQEVRDERAHRIQEVSRVTGADLDDPISRSLNMFEFTVYNFGHDEWQNSTEQLRNWESSRTHI
ncbi:FAD/NAD(P)-binding domain-containing protein [Xylariaceae sp. FL1272]|nr:FAD/NAD(P)-binding domain-containing protein [Xylariaceae sp. FL1272]